MTIPSSTTKRSMLIPSILTTKLYELAWTFIATEFYGVTQVIGVIEILLNAFPEDKYTPGLQNTLGLLYENRGLRKSIGLL